MYLRQLLRLGRRSACIEVLVDTCVSIGRDRTNQWSPCGSQPIEAVGDGPGSSVEAADETEVISAMKKMDNLILAR